MIKTAVVILNWNGLFWLQKFLNETVNLTADDETVVYVADNGSSDGSVEWVSNNCSGARLIKFEKNHGFAEGYNLALREISAQYYVLLNSDVEVTDGWLKPLIRFMDDNHDTASCQPKIKSYALRDHFEYAGAAGGFIDRFGYTFCRGRIFDIIEKDYGQYDDYKDIFWSTGACMVVRADSWKKCHGFDNDFFAHMEEVDLCWRFHRAGFRVSYIPESLVYHVGGGILPYESTLKTYLNFRNNLYMLYKNLPDKNFKTVIFFRLILDGLAAIMYLFKGKPGNSTSILKAHFDFYRNIKKLSLKRLSIKETGVENNCKSTVLNKSLVFLFYLKSRKTFMDLSKYMCQ